MHDYYETLQVHPRADQEAIEAAYARLSGLYDPARLAGSADELIALARRKRELIDQAYAVLRDPATRAGHDAELAAATLAPRGREADAPAEAETPAPAPLLDYRPLPPAAGKERDKRAAIRPTPAALPTQSGRRVGKARPLWFVPTVLAGTLTLTVTLVSLVVTSGVRQAPPPPAASQAQGGVADPAAGQGAPPTGLAQGSVAPGAQGQPQGQAPVPPQGQQGGPQQLLPLSEVVAEYDKQTSTAQQIAQQQQTSDAWVQYGNALYDSVMVVREREPTGKLYQDRLPLWVEATKAYSRALDLDPSNAVARADLAVSYCYYGGDSGDQALVRQGVMQAQEARQQAPKEPRVLLGLGVCLTQEEPPSTGEALDIWQQVVQGQPGSPEAEQAKVFIERYRSP